MDLTKIEPIDLLIFLGLFGMFLLGYVQGIVRRLIGIASMIFGLVFAAQARGPLGDYLAGQWTDQSAEYSKMVAFAAVFVAFVIASTVGIQWFYKTTPLLPRYAFAEEILGGVLGLIQGGILITAMLLILDPFFSLKQPANANEFGLFRTVSEALEPSQVAGFFRDRVVPPTVDILPFFFPDDVRAPFRR